MPELPEVEVTMRGIAPVLDGAVIEDVYVGDKPLREPMPRELLGLKGARVQGLSRRAKYILVSTDRGTIIMHLGMTGHLKVVKTGTPRVLHDHFDICLEGGTTVRLNDIRRFGLVTLVPPGEDPLKDRHLIDLGPEPFDPSFDGKYLKERLKGKKIAIKQALMDSKVVVGVGNIYASEVLFLSGISPKKQASRLTLAQCEKVAENIVKVLRASIESGGTTIRDFSGADGKLGYFVQSLNVYGHAGEPCKVCGTKIKSIVQGQRSTFYCPHCQK